MNEENKTVKSDESVGYGNPPSRTRFPKGQSGNPRGRPKGTPNMATVLMKALREKVIINENGTRKVITKLEAAVKQLSNKAASGDLRAFQLLAALLRSAEERNAPPAAQNAAVDEADEKVFLGILKRLEATSGGDGKNGNKMADAE